MDYDAVQDVTGSPPRVWGKPVLIPGIPLADRFTPTRVGKTVVLANMSRSGMVHPHACGENVDAFVGQVKAIGSPPRVWGKHRQPLAVARLARFTPTRVGKTLLCRFSRSPRRFTPTRVGKTRSIAVREQPMGGSPPRVWGKHVAPHGRAVYIRFTPTRVGKTDAPLAEGRRGRFTPTRVGKTYH